MVTKWWHHKCVNKVRTEHYDWFWYKTAVTLVEGAKQK